MFLRCWNTAQIAIAADRSGHAQWAGESCDQEHDSLCNSITISPLCIRHLISLALFERCLLRGLCTCAHSSCWLRKSERRPFAWHGQRVSSPFACRSTCCSQHAFACMQDGAGSATPSHPALHPYDPKYSLKSVSPSLPTRTPQQQQRQARENDESSNWQYDKGCWEAFHARDNATARFYKERRSPAAHGAMKHSCSVTLAAFVCTSRFYSQG